MSTLVHPEEFLSVRIDSLEPPVPLSAACAGYELGRWRCKELAKHILQWLPEFALTYSELSSISHANAVIKVAEAAQAIYTSDKYEKRGEFGEILLHILLRQHIGTIPAISKIYFKDSSNITVKGFDAVHVKEGSEFELWLGEVKFYQEIQSAITAVIKELKEHTDADYLRSEFVAITNKLDKEWEHSEELREKLARSRSLDEIFTEICIPVLLTYDSTVINSFDEVSDDFLLAFEQEVKENLNMFKDKLPSLPIKVHLFLLPLKEKKELVKEMDEALKNAQQLL